MPDHLHAGTERVPDAADRLHRVLLGHGLRFGARWDVGPVTAVSTRAIARRTAMYHWLNPRRAGLEPEPLRWEWSSLREQLGLTLKPWPGARTLRWSVSEVDAALERAGHGSLRPAHLFAPAVCEAEALVTSVAQALRIPTVEVTRSGPGRRLLVGLTASLGLYNPQALADLCGCTVRTIRRLRVQADPNAVAIGRRVLATVSRVGVAA